MADSGINQESKKQTLGITVRKSDDFSEWYNQVVQKSGMADFTNVKGFMFVRPLGYSIWEMIQNYFNERLHALNHYNAYAPALIPESLLAKEAEHVEGFTPEVFWVTQAGGEKLEERLALRPTSETIIGSAYSQWVRSWRDLPLLYNYWNSVFRSETKMTKLFVRTREFLWQEGHTVHASQEEAEKEVMLMLKEYEKLAAELLAIPVITGCKSESEKFAGAVYTTTIEALMPDSRCLQLGTSHYLGQNFAKAFSIQFLDEKSLMKTAYTTSWGFSARLLGAIVMLHADDKGLVLPPKVALHKCVIVPIFYEENKAAVLKAARKLFEILQKSGFNPILDDRDNLTAGFKFNEWELKGIPVRIELGPKDLAKKSATIVRRDTGFKEQVKLTGISKSLSQLLGKIQENLYARAEKFLKESTVSASDWDFFENAIENRKIVLAYHCGRSECEKEIQEKTTATCRCIPFGQESKIADAAKCILCGHKAKYQAYFARNY